MEIFFAMLMGASGLFYCDNAGLFRNCSCWPPFMKSILSIFFCDYSVAPLSRSEGLIFFLLILTGNACHVAWHKSRDATFDTVHTLVLRNNSANIKDT